MTRVELVVGQRPYRWQARIAERLREAGHHVSVTHIGVRAPWSAFAAFVLNTGARLLLPADEALWSHMDIAAGPRQKPDIRLDLTGAAPESKIPTLGFCPSPAAQLTTIAKGELPELAISLDGRCLAAAAPMVDDRTTVVRGFQDVLARLVTLTVATVSHWPDLPPAEAKPARQEDRNFLPAFIFRSAPRGMRELHRRIFYRFAHWRVGYRLIDGPGVATSGTLGRGWSVLGDDGQHFYADPFPFEREGRHYIFVEDFVHRDKKAVISVATIDDKGVASTPQPAIVEPYHLSYPQIFERDGQIWMLPQGNGGAVTLYRCTDFPYRWERAADLLHGEFSDATLLERDGRLWLLATARDGAGSTSDTLVVFSAPSLLGPWAPHKKNPILIDRRRARPGGAFVEIGGRTILPVQDGTQGYGTALGLSELLRLDDEAVELGDPRPVSGEGDFPYPQVHTLNRSGRLEVIDGILPMRKF